jgi:hypothetical protein
MAPGGGDEHVAAEAAAAHRLHRVVQVAARGADLDLQGLQLGAGLGPGLRAEPGGVLQRGQLRLVHLRGGAQGQRPRLGGHVAGGVLAAQHRAGGGVDRLQHLQPARRRLRLPGQDLAAEGEAGFAEAARQVRGHGIAHAPAQVGLPWLVADPLDHGVQLGEQGRVRQRDQVVLHPLGPEEGSPAAGCGSAGPARPPAPGRRCGTGRSGRPPAAPCGRWPSRSPGPRPRRRPAVPAGCRSGPGSGGRSRGSARAGRGCRRRRGCRRPGRAAPCRPAGSSRCAGPAPAGPRPGQS